MAEVKNTIIEIFQKCHWGNSKLPKAQTKYINQVIETQTKVKKVAFSKTREMTKSIR